MDKKRLDKRFWFGLFLLLVLVPLTIAFGSTFLENRKYLFISVMLLLYAMCPFFLAFEGRKPQAREITVIAVLSAITIAGRAVFYMIPHFKPVAAMVIISGVAMGAEAGFLVGCISMLASNFIFGQGPWTPWQMVAFGVIGFVAGILFEKGFVKKTKLALCCYGFFAVIILFGGIMNPASLIMYGSEITWKEVLAVYASGLPVDLLHACSTVVFLWIGAKPMLEKLERIKLKWGFAE